MTPPHAVGYANGVAQSIVSLARCFGPVLGGYVSIGSAFWRQRQTCSRICICSFGRLAYRIIRPGILLGSWRVRASVRSRLRIAFSSVETAINIIGLLIAFCDRAHLYQLYAYEYAVLSLWVRATAWASSTKNLGKRSMYAQMSCHEYL